MAGGGDGKGASKKVEERGGGKRKWREGEGKMAFTGKFSLLEHSTVVRKGYMEVLYVSSFHTKLCVAATAGG